MAIPLAAPVDFSKKAEVEKMAKLIKDALHKELAKDNPFGKEGNTTVTVKITKKKRKRRATGSFNSSFLDNFILRTRYG